MSLSLPHLLLLIALLLPATARATRLVTRDKIPVIGVPREAFVQRWGVYEDAKGSERLVSIGGKSTNIVMSSLAYLWECDWCTSVWVGAGLTYLTYHWPNTMLWVLIGFTAAYATGWGAKAEALIDKRKE